MLTKRVVAANLGESGLGGQGLGDLPRGYVGSIDRLCFFYTVKNVEGT